MKSDLVSYIIQQLENQGLDPDLSGYLGFGIGLILLVASGFLMAVVIRKIILRVLSKVVKHTTVKWDNVLMEKRFFLFLAYVAAAYILQASLPHLFPQGQFWQVALARLLNVYILVMSLLALNALVSTLEYFLKETPGFRDKPIDSYAQLFRLGLVLFGGVVALSIFLDKSPLFFLSTFGAMTAIILLIFKDTLLGLVASITISVNDLVQVGDWVEMPKYGADGDVTQITLNTVKVRNFDKTITTIPTYAFTADSFKNWRGMRESGGRRIKRAIHIKIQSIKFCTEEMLQRFRKYQLIQDYLEERQKEILRFNEEQGVDKSELLNGRNLTNVGLFREYAERYLRTNPHISQAPNMLLMVRHLEPTELGLPVQIYCFTRTTVWAEYERIQADIFDHLLAVVPRFDLEVHESPTGTDFQALASR